MGQHLQIRLPMFGQNVAQPVAASKVLSRITRHTPRKINLSHFLPPHRPAQFPLVILNPLHCPLSSLNVLSLRDALPRQHPERIRAWLCLALACAWFARPPSAFIFRMLARIPQPIVLHPAPARREPVDHGAAEQHLPRGHLCRGLLHPFRQALAYVRQRHPQDALLLAAVFTGWAATAPAAAASNVHRLGNRATQQAVLNQVFAKWAGGSGVANAADYLRQMPPSSVTDQMRLSVSQGLASVSPLDAWNIAKSIQNADAQTRALKHALSAMIFVDSAQAVQVFNSTDLPPGTKRVLGRLLDAVGAR